MSEKNSGKNGGKLADSATFAPQEAANGAAQLQPSKNNPTVKLGKDCDFGDLATRDHAEKAVLRLLARPV